MRIAWWVLAVALATGCATSGTGGAGGAGSGGASSCPDDLPASCPPGAAGYAATIAPMFATSCVACHSPGGTSVHYLRTWAEVNALRGPVLDQVYACKMPTPGLPPLTTAERVELLGWLVCGAPDD